MITEIQIPSPITRCKLAGCEIFIKREDLIHPFLSGNKYRKLKHTLIELKDEDIGTVISFGGAYSNHIHALAFACQFYSLRLILFIRGEKVSNPTLSFVKSCGAEVIFLNRTSYREIKNQKTFPEYPNAKVIPEGGSNKMALLGIKEMMQEINIPDAQYCVSYGSGATSIGMMSCLSKNDDLHIFSALKFPSFSSDFNSKCVELGVAGKNVQLHGDYHFGGYAKWNNVLIDFINQYEIDLDPIYTGKLFYGVSDLLNKELLDRKRPIVLIHTGGLQGIAGFNSRFGGLIH